MKENWEEQRRDCTDLDDEFAEQYWLGHRERLRQRMEQSGPDAIKSHELLEMMLFYAMPRMDTSDVARALINSFGSVKAVLNASRQELMAVPGMTPVMAEWVGMTGELVNAYTSISPKQMPRLWRYRDLLGFLAPMWREVPAPCCCMVYADYDYRLMTWTEISNSLYWFVPEVVQDAVLQAISLQARYAFMVMFTGVEPLELDRGEMENLEAFAYTLRCVDVELLDCVLVGEQGFLSLNKEGRMACIREESAMKALHERYCAEEDFEPEGKA